jgi:ribosomal protein L13E
MSLLLILRPLIPASSGHERMSEVGKHATTAECRLVGLFSREAAALLIFVDLNFRGSRYSSSE